MHGKCWEIWVNPLGRCFTPEPGSKPPSMDHHSTSMVSNRIKFGKQAEELFSLTQSRVHRPNILQTSRRGLKFGLIIHPLRRLKCKRTWCPKSKGLTKSWIGEQKHLKPLAGNSRIPSSNCPSKLIPKCHCGWPSPCPTNI